jgi:hypothetical protein
MPSAKPALLRCENLDLFAPPPEAAAMPADVVGGDAQAPEPDSFGAIEPENQLDLFRHSPTEIAAAEARRALKDRAVVLARDKFALLRHAPSYAHFVAAGDGCLELIERNDPRWADPGLAVPWIESELWPAAEHCLQRDAMLLVRPALLALIDCAGQCSFDPDRQHAHPSYLWHLLGEPAQAVAAVELDPCWRDRVSVLCWHAELSEQAGFHDRVHADVVELCLASPDAAESWLSASREWATRWSAWCDLDDALPLCAFPAWCRLTRSSEFPLPATNDQRPGAELLRVADRLARNAHDLALRKMLHALCPALLATYLATRIARTA